MRLNKFLSIAGVASRRKADELISQGKIYVNGKVASELGTYNLATFADLLKVTAE